MDGSWKGTKQMFFSHMLQCVSTQTISGCKHWSCQELSNGGDVSNELVPWVMGGRGDVSNDLVSWVMGVMFQIDWYLEYGGWCFKKFGTLSNGGDVSKTNRLVPGEMGVMFHQHVKGFWWYLAHIGCMAVVFHPSQHLPLMSYQNMFILRKFIGKKQTRSGLKWCVFGHQKSCGIPTLTIGIFSFTILGSLCKYVTTANTNELKRSLYLLCTYRSLNFSILGISSELYLLFFSN